MTHVVGRASLTNMTICDGDIVADTICFENLDLRLVSAVILHEENGPTIQMQVPARGLTQNQTDACLCLTGFCLFSQDLPDYDSLSEKCDLSDPCAMAEKFECCLVELALDKENKASFSYRDTSITFRKQDVVFIERMMERYKMKCMQKKCGSRQSARRWRLPICR